MRTPDQLARAEQTHPERWRETPLTEEQVDKLRSHLGAWHRWTASQLQDGEGALRRLHFEEHVERAHELYHGDKDWRS